MALDVLEGIKAIDGFGVSHLKLQDGGPVEWNSISQPVFINHVDNRITFQLQNGPIKEVGTNGCQVDTLITAAAMIVEGLNTRFPCAENQTVIADLTHALQVLKKRKQDREARGVEGTSNL